MVNPRLRDRGSRSWSNSESGVGDVCRSNTLGIGALRVGSFTKIIFWSISTG